MTFQGTARNSTANNDKCYSNNLWVIIRSMFKILVLSLSIDTSILRNIYTDILIFQILVFLFSNVRLRNVMSANQNLKIPTYKKIEEKAKS
jgi:hypothetical protein